jgi:hypothetical protein
MGEHSRERQMTPKQKIYRPEQPVVLRLANDTVYVTLANGIVLSAPLSRFPWLANASAEQRNNYEFDAYLVYWPDLDDAIDIDWLMENQFFRPNLSPIQLHNAVLPSRGRTLAPSQYAIAASAASRAQIGAGEMLSEATDDVEFGELDDELIVTDGWQIV